MSSLEAAWQTFVELAGEEERELERFPGRYPHYSNDGQWHRVPIDETSGWVDESFYDHGNWTAGFSVGHAWLSRLDGSTASASSPIMQSALADISKRATDQTTHDLGFLFYPSFALGQVLGMLSDEEAAPALTAARVLGSRFNEAGQFIQAFGPRTDPRSAGTSTIDTMMNLPLLWWASKQDEDDGLSSIARRHAATSAKHFFREDGSTFHLIRFNPESGDLLEQGTFQGASASSCWSRGQAWAIAGFAWAFGATGDGIFAEAALRAWEYFARRVPSSGVVPWDFGDSSADAVPDASASAIAALGGFLLAACHPSQTVREDSRVAAEAILTGLDANAVRRDSKSQGILLHSCYSKPHGLGISGATPYGDFYYGLALALATGRLKASDLFATPLPTKGTTASRSHGQG
jgi:unsaturated chondroitin disaccharide hydrolase